jgi:hypothetical protein
MRKPWQGPGGTGEEVTTAHYLIHTTCKTRTIEQYLPGFMEAAYGNYLTITGMRDRDLGPLSLYMLATRQEWEGLTKAIFGRSASLVLSIQAGGYSTKGIGVFWDIGPLATFSVASHEGLHQFFYHRMKNHLPMWLEEGLCTTAEGYEMDNGAVTFTPRRNTARMGDLNNALSHGYWIAAGDLVWMDAGDVVQKSTEQAVGYYGQLWALSLFLQSQPKYREGLRRLLSDAEQGKIGEAINLSPQQMDDLARTGRNYNRVIGGPVFKAYIAQDLKEFDREFRPFAVNLAGLK